MALSFKDSEVDELARELARLTRKPIAEAVRDGLRREVERAKAAATDKSAEDFVERVFEIGRRYCALPTVSQMSDDEILGYDENGIPTK